MNCPKCADKGLIRVAYESGEPFDVAICTCRHGRVWRQGGEALVRQRMNLTAEHQVSYLEHVEDEPAAPTAEPDFIAAGRTRKVKL